MVMTTERLKKKYEKAATAFKSLEEAVRYVSDAQEVAQASQRDPETMYRVFRDSLVQRFEYTFDTTWKYLAIYLEYQGLVLIQKSPKIVFRESLKSKILSESEVRVAIEMVDHRNLTTHGYDEDLVEEISKNIPNYTQLLGQILKRSKFKNS